jgi:hypothetical protein
MHGKQKIRHPISGFGTNTPSGTQRKHLLGRSGMGCLGDLSDTRMIP